MVFLEVLNCLNRELRMVILFFFVVVWVWLIFLWRRNFSVR